MANELVHTNAKGDIIVDFSGEAKAKKIINDRSKLTEYANVDLASGYPKDMIWTTLDGRRIAIPNLSDSHLLNILAYVRRHNIEYKRQIAILIAIRGTSAVMGMSMQDLWGDAEEFSSIDPQVNTQIYTLAIQSQINKIMDMDDEEFLRKYMPIYAKLYQEAYKRKILIEVDKSKVTHG